MCTAVGGAIWEGMGADSVALDTAPLFHVTGMQHSMNAPIFAGATIALLPRWDPEAAGYMIERYGCTHWANVPTMVVGSAGASRHRGPRSVLAAERIRRRRVDARGGGAEAVRAVRDRVHGSLRDDRDHLADAYEPAGKPAQAVPGHPDLRHRVAGRSTPTPLQPLGPNQQGEIVVARAAGVQGLLEQPRGHRRDVSSNIDGKRFLRTGDLGYYDEDGYFYIADRLKRMINAAGYKVWPAEVEMTLYKHPDIRKWRSCRRRIQRRGETVKAFVVLKPRVAGTGQRASRSSTGRAGHMAAYKVPRAGRVHRRSAALRHRQDPVARCCRSRSGQGHAFDGYACVAPGDVQRRTATANAYSPRSTVSAS